MECSSGGILECCNDGTLECWNAGMVERWKGGYIRRRPAYGPWTFVGSIDLTRTTYHFLLPASHQIAILIVTWA